ncbi:sialate O-acetylesterase [Klebsiella pneumoniae]|uniref:sialate O-acetylesterase n=1 Tax=Klebsiella pneumoniae TaxID=573 RepID=UPI0018896B2E|nr:sialate O-acetylesterase [Klebsiella pneumoniae]
MGEYNTGNPVPSSAMPDVWDNNATIDEFVNSPELTLTTRTGTERDTLAGIQKKSDDQRVQMAEDGAAVVEETRQNLIPLSRQYMTLAAAQADIANIPVGSTTYYRSPDDSALAVEVMNVSGTLQPTGRKMPSQAAVDGAVILAGSANDATAGLITALESLALLFAQAAGDISETQRIARENSDAVARVLTAYELLTSRVANVPEELAQIQLNFGFSLDIVLDSLFKLSKYDFDDFITSGDIPATIKPVGQLPYIPADVQINGFISYGQSLSNGGGAGNSAISTTQPYSNLTYSSGPVGTTFAATKPLVESGPETICSGMSNYASLTALRDDGVKPEDHVIFSGAPGRGSTSIAALSKGGAAWTKFENFVKNMPVVNVGKSCALHAISWLQGENDQAPDRTPYATYLAALLQLQVDITELAQTELGQTTPVYMLTYQHNTHTTINNSATQRAFVQAQRQSDYFTLVTPTYPFPHNTDTIHLTSVSYKWLGAYFGRAYKQLVIERRRPDNVFPMGATWSGNEVRVKFRVPAAPLTFNTTRVPLTTNYGFKVQTAAGVAIDISSVAIEGDDTVLITLSSTPAAAPLVRYALDYLAPGLVIVNGASGNLCDSTNEKCTFGGTDYSMEYYSPAFELQSYTISI